MTNFLTNIDYIFFALIMWAVMFIFYHKFMNSDGRMKKTLLIISFLVFFIILTRHYFDCRTKHGLGIECMDDEKLTRLKNHSNIDPHNSAVILAKNLLAHPMFGYNRN